MDFALSEEQELLQETVRGFVARECPAGVVRTFFDGDAAHHPTLWKGLAGLGVAGLLVPERFGGAGLGMLELALVSEELGRGSVPGPFLGHALATLALCLGGSAAQQARWLPGLATGETQASVALGEPDGRWEPGAWTAENWAGRVRGGKDFVPGGAGAHLLVVGVAGGGLVLVETGADAVRLEPIESLDRTRRLDRLVLEDAPCEALPGDVAGRVRDAGCVLLAADAFGAAFQLVRASAEYAGTRRQFGRTIGEFQAVKHQLADMALDVDPTRGLWWYAAHAFDELPDESERAAALAKAHVTDRATQVARAAVEVHGGIGFTWECDVQIAFKRVLFDRIFLGTPEAHRERVARLGGW